MRYIVHGVLKPPPPDDLAFVDTTDRVVGHQRLVRSVRPRLLIVHDVRDFVVVRPYTVLLDVVAPSGQWIDVVVGEDSGVRMDHGMVIRFAPVTE